MTQLKILVIQLAILAFPTPNLYESIVTRLSNTETAATPKYMYVGHARVLRAQGVREMFWPLGSVTVR